MLNQHSLRLPENPNFFAVASIKNPYVYLYTLRSLDFSTPRTSDFQAAYHLVDFVNKMKLCLISTASFYFINTPKLSLRIILFFNTSFPFIITYLIPQGGAIGSLIKSALSMILLSSKIVISASYPSLICPF